MLFPTWQFLAFLIAVLVGLLLLRTRTLQHVLILLASWFFYACWEPIFLVLLLGCTVNDYALGLAIGRARTPRGKRLWLVASLVTNLGVLGLFKYYDFFAESLALAARAFGLSAAVPALGLVLPVGISFYTFHSMGYNIDVYRGRPPERSFLRFAIYVAYFPQLVAGPILRSGQFLPELVRPIRFTAENLRDGCHLFLSGLVKKAVVADNVAPLVDHLFTSPEGLPSLFIWVATFSFGVQIYCDFSGYTDMARGVSRMLGIEIPINFNHPYLARSITDFWRRWHISLSSWLRDYLYIPLGGNRRGPRMAYRNLMVTMVLGGLWHGAHWNFVLWGFYQGFLLSVERLFSRRREPPPAKEDKRTLPEDGPAWREPPPEDARLRRRVPRWLVVLLSWAACQYLVFLGWILFRVTDLHDLWYCVYKYVAFDFDFRITARGFGKQNPFMLTFILAAFCLLHLYSYRVGGLANRLGSASRTVQFVVYALAVFALLALWPPHTASFIYFQF
jgi:alginate O-acetyltransferase complex protein AlgI